MMRRLAKFLGVRAGELTLAGSVAAVFFTVQAGHGLGTNTADALFFLRFGVEYLPLLFMVTGLVTMAAMVGYGAALAHYGSRVFMPALPLALAVILAAERFAILLDVRLLYPVVWVTESLTVFLTFTLMWATAGEVCDTRQAKRLFPLFASAGIAGGMLGNFATGPLAALLGTESLLLVHAGLLTGATLLILRVSRRYFRPGAAAEPGLADLRTRFAWVWRSGLLRLVALSSVAIAALFFLVVFGFSEAVAAAFPTEAQLAAYLGVFAGLATAGSFAVSLLLAHRLFARIGVVNSLFLLPLVYLAGFLLWLVAFDLATATAVRGLQWVVLNGLALTAWSALFNVVEPRRRGQVLAFVAGGPQQVGVILAGALLLGVQALLTPREGFAVAAGLALVTAVLVWRMHRAYAAALLDALRKGLVWVFGTPQPGVQQSAGDAEAAAAAVAAIADQRPALRRIAAETLARLPPRARPPEALLIAAQDDCADVRAAALRALAAIADPRIVPLALSALHDRSPTVRKAAVPMVAALAPDAPDLQAALDDSDPFVRAEAASVVRSENAQQVLTRLTTEGPAAHVQAALDAVARWPSAASAVDPAAWVKDPRPPVRRAAAGALAATDRKHDGPLLVALLEDRDPGVRHRATAGLRARPDGAQRAMAVLSTGPARAYSAALEVLRASTDAVRSALVDWTCGRIGLAADLQRLSAALDEPAASPVGAPSAGDYLRRVLTRRAEECETVALQALGVLGSPQHMAVVTRGVRSADAQIRSQALEALETLGEPRLVRQLLPLLEDRPDPPEASRVAALQTLLDDADEWLRALATRALAEEYLTGLAALRARAARDHAPQVAAALPDPGGAMPETNATLSVLDRMLILQQVPMFADLGPEDLEPIAAIASERWYSAGEEIYREGETGEEMLLIAEGSVRVSRDIAGETHLIRSYGEGEHVGELALLRGQPRSADVNAEAEVRALVLPAPAFKVILMERPDAALAMLATLAERLGTVV